MYIKNNLDCKSSISTEIRGLLEQIVKTGSLSVELTNKKKGELLWNLVKHDTGYYELIITDKVIEPDVCYYRLLKDKPVKIDLSVKV